MPYPDGNSEYLGVLSAASGLAKSLFGDPETKMKADLYKTHGAYYNAAADKARAEAQGQMNQNTAQGSLAQLFGARPDWANDPVLRQQAVSQFALANPAHADKIGAVVRSGYAAGANPDQGTLASLFMGAGGNYAHTQPGFMQEDATKRRGQDIESGDRRYNAGLDYNAAMAGHGMTDARERWKFLNGDVTTPENSTVRLSPARAQTMGLPGVVSGQVSAGQGENVYPVVPVADRPVVQGQPSASGKGGAPLDISPTDATKLDEMIAALVPAGYSLTPEDTTRVRNRTAELYQQSRNAQTALSQAWTEIMGANPATEGGWNPFVANTVRPDPKLAAPVAPAPKPAGGAPAAGGKAPQQIIDEANDAIRRGADPAKVRERLRAMGIDLGA